MLKIKKGWGGGGSQSHLRPVGSFFLYNENLKYISSKFNAYNMNTHTHTHPDPHTNACTFTHTHKLNIYVCALQMFVPIYVDFFFFWGGGGLKKKKGALIHLKFFVTRVN